MVNDCFPYRGYHRKPYMALGWVICTAALGVLAYIPMPEPGESGAAGKYCLLMSIVAAGYIMSDVAADGLTVENAKKEDVATRGTLQSNVYLVRTLGSIAAALLVGFGMNGKEYSGDSEFSLSFAQLCGVLAVPAALMVPVSWYWVYEPRKPRTVSVKTYARDCYELLSHKAMFYVAVYSLAHGAIGDINTTAAGNVMKVWAGVHNMQAALFGVVAAAIFATGLYLVKTYLLHVNWRHIIIGTTILLTVIDLVFTYCTIYNVLRNQYFFLGESVVVMVPAAARFLMTTFVVVEMAQDGKEGLTYGLLTTLHNLGGPVAQAISNSLFATFTPSLSNAQNYKRDTQSFRNTVATSYGVGYAMGLIALLLLPLFPSQKAQARQRMQDWGSDTRYAKAIIAITAVTWLYSVTMNMLAIFPQTQCLQFVGGDGC